MLQPRFGQGLTDMLVVRWYLKLYGILGGIFECRLRCLAVGQQAPHGNHRQHSDSETEQPGYCGCEHIHGLACLFGIKARDNHVGRGSDEGADSAHAGGIAQGYQQLRRRNAQPLGPHLDDVHKHGHHRRIAQERAQRRHGQHQPHHRLLVGTRLSEQILDYPLQHTGMVQARHYHEQNAHSHHRRRAEARECLAGIEHSGDVKHPYCYQKGQIGTDLRKQQHREQRQNGDDGNPGIDVKAEKHDILHLFKSDAKITITAIFAA